MTAITALPVPTRLTDLLDGVARDCTGLGKITLGDLIIRLEERATLVLLALFALPFITPIPTAGLSMPFGFAAAVIGLGILLDRQPPWPDRLLQVNLPAGLVGRLISAGSRIWGLVDRLMRPRLAWMVTAKPCRRLHGFAALTSGILLALPLPIPFSNALPAITLLVLAAGLLQRDGLALMAAQVGFLVTLCFFATVAWLGWEGLQRMLAWFN